jgi:hypothetical protein
MWLNRLTYDGVVLIDVERTQAYAKVGVAPQGWQMEDQQLCDGLTDALGEGPYRTPDYDEPPWYNVSDPATHGFAGLLPIDITGMEGSSFTGEVTENPGDGGVVTVARRATRTFAATAVLIGESDDALHAGLEWLTGVVLRTCGDTTLPATLETFTACPALDLPAEDVDAPLVQTTVSRSDPGWLALYGIWDYVSRFTVTGTNPAIDETGLPVVGGGAPSTPETGLPIVGGGGPTDSGGPIVGGGVIDIPTPYAVLAAPVPLDCLSEVVMTWHVTPLPGMTSVGVRAAAVSANGEVLAEGPIVGVAGATTVSWTVTDAPWDNWRPALLTLPDGVIVTSMTYSRHPDIDVDACLRPYRRTFTRVKCIQAPTVTSVITSGDDCDGSIWQVEWTWVAEDPYRYLDPVVLATGVTLSGTQPTYRAPGVIAMHEPLTVGATDCPLPDTTPGDCVFDPTLPGFTAPPVAPLIGRTTDLTPASWRRSVLALDPSVVPALGQGALTLTLNNDGTAKRGIRIRSWRQTDPDYTTRDECGFEAEMWIDYLDNNAVLTIDTVHGTVTAVCDDGSLTDAQGVMHGPYQGSFVYPVIACGERYFIAVDVPASQGDLTWDLSYAVREG